jgi:sulfide:quinone oxidoreductase
VIVGGGSAGIAVAAQLRRRLPKQDRDIAIVEPKDVHYYQPLWTLVGGGLARKENSARPEQSVIPRGARWVRSAVRSFHPESNELETKDGNRIKYEYLVVATGVELDLDKIKGLRAAIGKEGVTTNYSYDYVDKTFEFMSATKRGNAIFTFPDTPVKCGGAPQKIMYLADDFWRKHNVRDDIKITYAIPSAAMFAVKKYSDTLDQLVVEKGIETKFKHTLVEVRSNTKEAVFKDGEGKEVVMKYDFLHVTPPMGPSGVIKNSPLAAANGFVDVDKHTLQHVKYPNVFSLGDCANLPTSKTIAAITQQAPTVVSNLLAATKNQPPVAKYNGYTSCPITVGNKKLVLAEFGYDNVIMETFPFDQAKPRFSMYFLKKYVFPASYWNLFLRGWWFGPSTIFYPKQK